MSKKLTIEEVKERLKDRNPNAMLLSEEYMGYETKMRFKCLVDGHEWETKLNNILYGSGCPACAGKVVTKSNCLATRRPDLVKYFANPDEALKVTVSNTKKIQTRCPDCGQLKDKLMTVNTLSSQGFSCSYCRDGISTPEKFVSNLLKELNVDFTTQHSPSWSGGRKYDFYIVGLKVVIEVHGEQHYKDSRRGRTIKNEQQNDLFKLEQALLNSIELDNYVVINARYSTFKWLKENCTESLKEHFDLSNVDWLKIWEKCQKSLALEICEAWKNRKADEVITDIAKQFDIGAGAVRERLKTGTELGWCSYCPKEENKKGRFKASKTRGKKTYQYTKSGEFVREFESTTQAERQTKSHRDSISRCCLNKIKTSGGFIWSYLPPEKFSILNTNK